MSDLVDINAIKAHSEWRNYKIRSDPSQKKYGYQARIRVKPHTTSKFFPFKSFAGDKEACKSAAFEWTRKKEEDLRIAFNMIRFLNKDIIEVQANYEGKIMNFITDKKFIYLIVNNTWTIQKGQTSYTYYVCRQYDSKEALFHKAMTGFKITDHINREGRDNRPSNLRDGANGQNQYNRNLQKNNTSGHNGIIWRNTKNHRYCVYGWREGEDKKSKYFNVIDYDNDEEKTKEAALTYKKQIIKYLEEKTGIEYSNGESKNITYEEIVNEELKKGELYGFDEDEPVKKKVKYQ